MIKQNRQQQRASVAKLKKLNDAEIDAVVIRYLTSLKSIPWYRRLEFGFRLFFKMKLW